MELKNRLQENTASLLNLKLWIVTQSRQAAQQRNPMFTGVAWYV
jgi:hypothetical protein